MQTADILAEALNFKGDLLVAVQLAPGFGPKALDQLLEAHPQAEEIALVGHEPDLGELAQSLLATDVACTLKKGAVVSFKIAAGDRGKAEFLQLVTSGGKIITSRAKLLERFQAENIKRETGKRSV